MESLQIENSHLSQSLKPMIIYFINLHVYYKIQIRIVDCELLKFACLLKLLSQTMSL